MIRACPKCKAKNRLPTDGDVNQLGRPVCASCGNYLFPENFENETDSFQTVEFGTVYIHKHVKGQNVKVGETKNSNSEDRRRDYAKVHQTEGFEPHKDYPVLVGARQDIEKRAHKILRSQGYGMSFGTAREIFACTPEIAEAAVEKAIAESEVNRIEEEKQRQQQIKRDKLAKAQAKYDKQLEVFREGWLREWEASQWVKSKKSVLDKFVAETPFEKEGKRTFFDYFVISLGWLLLIWGAGMILGGIRHIFDPIPNNGFGTFLMILGIGGGAIWFGKAWISYPIQLVPNKEALSKKVAMEEEIETNKQTIIANAKNDFEKHFTLKDFYE
ncbi:GIY-YIG nuclease family protein [bacterium]|nr:GIY-YIG nuclease family protein [bacterium]